MNPSVNPEGNYYISELVPKGELRGNIGLAFSKCREPAAAYAACVDRHQTQRSFGGGCCEKERRAMRDCVSKALKAT
jgi:hypothetical protein